MKLSIVTTLYQSSAYIAEFCARAGAVARDLVGEDFEIILVNDGSPDDSLAVAINIYERENHVKVIDLSRNFGHHKAMLLGLSQACGDKVFLLDSDLEEDPEWLVEFSEEMKESGCDVVFGVQEKRKGGIFERVSGWIFYRIFNLLTGLALPDNPVTARLMTRRYLDAFLLHEEREISIGGLFLITGFDQRPYSVCKHSTSQSTYSLTHKLTVMVDSITSFSNKPLIGIFYVGLIILILASAYLGFLLFNKLLYATPLTGWTSVMASIWLLGGLVILFVGVIGIYLSRVFSETKQRPNAIIRQIYVNNGEPDNE